MDILVHMFRSSVIRVCQGFVYRGFQTVILFVKDYSGPVYFVRQF